ncbi:MAG TPA: right-handed parallel beta-helix repeat-containing protein, partial [Polyangiaceae bacterium]|nr:right-handed parallel beta-helix repeat-containing protein [Polyangiaceae bacterium]
RGYALLLGNASVNTNITVQGLTVRNYGEIGLWTYSACNRLVNNKISDIGDLGSSCVLNDDPPAGLPRSVFNRAECTTQWVSGNVPSGCACPGFSGILISYGGSNHIKHNDITNSLNGQATDQYMHAIYVSNGSTQNVIEDNYIRGVSGAPVKFSSGGSTSPSNNNLLIRNYIDRSGNGNVFTDDPDSGGVVSSPNTLDHNVATFSSFRLPNMLFGNNPQSFVPNSSTPDLFQGERPDYLNERVAAVAVADVLHDPPTQPQVFVALNYPTSSFTKVVYKDSGKANTELRTIAFSASGWQVKALAAGRFNATGPHQLVMAVEKPVGGGGIRTKIVVGSLVDGVYRFDDNINDLPGAGNPSSSRILYDFSGDPWPVKAMTAGKFAGDTTDKLITSTGLRLFRGDGKTPQSGTTTLGVSAANGAPLYTYPSGSTVAITNGTGLSAGGIPASANSVILARNDGASTYVALHDGVSFIAPVQLASIPNGGAVTSLAFGKFGTPTAAARLVTATSTTSGSTTTRAIYTSQGNSLLSNKLYESVIWSTTGMAAGNVDENVAQDELVLGFDSDDSGAPRTAVKWGNGATIYSSARPAPPNGVNNGGEYYRTGSFY